jgi:hypothetical protein
MTNLKLDFSLHRELKDISALVLGFLQQDPGNGLSTRITLGSLFMNQEAASDILAIKAG